METPNRRFRGTPLEKLPEGVQRGLEDFIGILGRINYFNPDRNPKPEWRMYCAYSWEGAHVAAGSAPLGLNIEEARAMPRARDVSRNTAFYAGRREQFNEAMKLVKTAVEERVLDHYGTDVSRDAVEAAQFAAGLIVISDLDYVGKERYMELAKEMMEVFAKGYGFAAEAYGKLYVYYKLESGMPLPRSQAAESQ
ncbi:MAG: hypothetical protein KGH98_02755 [Candidatus Micrarchaeota archaeon]|nr:hypothetical protein [Candidatus Micrarchaeota archaeon]